MSRVSSRALSSALDCAALFAAIGFLASVALPAQAQQQEAPLQREQAIDGRTQGFFVAAHFAGHRIAYADAGRINGDTQRKNGIGGSVEVGYGLNEYVGAFLAFEGAEMGYAENRSTRYATVYLEAGIEGTLPTGTPAVPFVRAIYSRAGGTLGAAAGDFVFSPNGYAAEGGLRYFLSESFALTGSATYVGGTYDAPGSEGAQRFDNMRLGVGAVFYPF